MSARFRPDCSAATYAHRIDDPDHYNFCTVPSSGADALLVAGASVVLACAAAATRAPELAVLFAGATAQALAFRGGIGGTGGELAARLANGVALWLGLRPADLLALVFLPPVLLYDACRVDFFLLRRVALQTAVLAVVTVAATALGLVPVMLTLLGLRREGWRAVDVALFGATLASTDAVSVSSVLESGGAPGALAAVLQAEALFNDATSMTLFELFRGMAAATAAAAAAAGDGRASSSSPSSSSSSSSSSWAAVVCEMAGTVARLSAVGAAVGLAAGLVNVLLLRLVLQRRRAPAAAEVALPLGLCYVAYYLAQSVLGGSGVVAVVAYGLSGAASTLWGLSPWARAAGAFDGFWSVAAFALNGAVFFFAGASSANFLLRASATLFREAGLRGVLVRALVRLPVVYAAVFAIRAGVMLALFPLLGWLGAERTLDPRAILFATAGGLRGALCLILAQTLVAGGGGGGSEASAAAAMNTTAATNPLFVAAGGRHGGGGSGGSGGGGGGPHPAPPVVDDVLASSALWASGFTVMTLVINGPLLKPLLSRLRLDAPTPQELAARRSGVELLQRAASAAVAGLRAGKAGGGGGGGGDVLRGVDWRAVEEVVDLSKPIRKLGLAPPPPPAAARGHGGGGAATAAGAAVDAVAAMTPRASRGDSALKEPLLPTLSRAGTGEQAGAPAAPAAAAARGAAAAAADAAAAAAAAAADARAAAGALLGLDLDSVAGGSSSDGEGDADPPPRLQGDSAGGDDDGDEDQEEDDDGDGDHHEGEEDGNGDGCEAGANQQQQQQQHQSPRFALFPPGRGASVLRICPGAPREPSLARSLGRGGQSLHRRSRRGLSAASAPTTAEAEAEAEAERRALREERRGVVSDVFMLQRADSAVLDRRFALPRRGPAAPQPPRAAVAAAAAQRAAAAPPSSSSSSAYLLPTSSRGPVSDFGGPPARNERSFMSRFGLGARLSFLHPPAPAGAVAAAAAAAGGPAPRLSSAGDAGPLLVLQSRERPHRHHHRHHHHHDPWRPPPHADDGGGNRGRAATAAAAAAAAAACDAAVLAAHRARLLSGFKRFFHAKHKAGLLSGAGLRLLEYSCDLALHSPERPLALWATIERVSLRSPLVSAQSRAMLALRRAASRLARFAADNNNGLSSAGGRRVAAAARLAAPLARAVAACLGALAQALSERLSAHALQGLELALELWLALSQSPQSRLLAADASAAAVASGPSPSSTSSSSPDPRRLLLLRQLVRELRREAAGVWSWVVAREVEAPERFGAVQTFRAQNAALRQALAALAELEESGVVEDRDAHALRAALQRRALELERRGPAWTQPRVADLMRASRAFRGADPAALEALRAHSELLTFGSGELIYSDDDAARRQQGVSAASAAVAPGGFFLVVSGVVRVVVRLPPRRHASSSQGASPRADASGRAPSSSSPPYSSSSSSAEVVYSGQGTVFGLTSALLGRPLAALGTKRVFAEANALGRGPVLLHVPASLVRRVLRNARRGNAQCAALERCLLSFCAAVVCVQLRPSMEAALAGAVARCVQRLLTPAARAALGAGGRERALLEALSPPPLPPHALVGGGEAAAAGSMDGGSSAAAEERAALELLARDLLVAACAEDRRSSNSSSTSSSPSNSEEEEDSSGSDDGSSSSSSSSSTASSASSGFSRGRARRRRRRQQAPEQQQEDEEGEPPVERVSDLLRPANVEALIGGAVAATADAPRAEAEAAAARAAAEAAADADVEAGGVGAAPVPPPITEEEEEDQGDEDEDEEEEGMDDDDRAAAAAADEAGAAHEEEGGGAANPLTAGPARVEHHHHPRGSAALERGSSPALAAALRAKAAACWAHLRRRLGRDGRLLRLGPGEPVRLGALLVLLDGALHRDGGGAEDASAAASAQGDRPLRVLRAPAVLVWAPPLVLGKEGYRREKQRLLAAAADAAARAPGDAAQGRLLRAGARGAVVVAVA